MREEYREDLKEFMFDLIDEIRDLKRGMIQEYSTSIEFDIERSEEYIGNLRKRAKNLLYNAKWKE